MSILRVVYITVPNENVANTLARSFVEKKLAACVNIVSNVKSVYEWEGKLSEDNELLLIVKTQQSHLESLQEELKQNHPYEVPEFVALPIDYASEPYGKWMLEQTKNK
ncbi:unnamed protein product [Auanema sp. JU1783]|nr:unnamed protein product [Auanema sp. JU1783]